MKLETIEDYKKESRYLYLLLKEMHRDITKDQIMRHQIPVGSEYTLEEVLESLWNIYQLEKNIKEEDYNI